MGYVRIGETKYHDIVDGSTRVGGVGEERAHSCQMDAERSEASPTFACIRKRQQTMYNKRETEPDSKIIFFYSFTVQTRLFTTMIFSFNCKTGVLQFGMVDAMQLDTCYHLIDGCWCIHESTSLSNEWSVPVI